jgi:transcriptional regulator with XRE-family HTH domain
MRSESLFFTDEERCDDQNNRIYAGEELTFNVTEELLIIMEDKGITKSQLAEKLGKTKAYVSQLLSGSRNMTLRTLSDLCFALGVTPSVDFQEIEDVILFENVICSSDDVIWDSNNHWEDALQISLDCSDTVISSSNVLYRQERDFWHKAA